MQSQLLEFGTLAVQYEEQTLGTGLLWREENQRTWEKASEQGEDQQQTQPTDGTRTEWNLQKSTLIASFRSYSLKHHISAEALPLLRLKLW